MRGRKIKQLVALFMVMILIIGNSTSVIGAGGAKSGSAFHILDGAGAKIINGMEKRTTYIPVPGAGKGISLKILVGLQVSFYIEL